MNQETLTIIGIICFLEIVFFGGLLVGTYMGERASGRYKKEFKAKRRECRTTYAELERTREEVCRKADEITVIKAKLFDIKEAAENYKKECDNIAETAEEYFNRYTIVSRIAIKHGLTDVCNKTLAENGLPTIEKSAFDEYV